MNYLAHIHLGHVTATSMLGNFLGDFVKGSDLSYLPESIRHGVWMHRKIDSYTDRHRLVKQLKASFPPNIRRMAGVIIDIYFDFLLCKHWYRYCVTPLSHILDRFYQQLGQQPLALIGRYNAVRDSLLSKRWLAEYQSLEGCVRAFKQIEARLNYRIKFSEDARQYLTINGDHLEQQFLEFYPELLEFTQTINRNSI
ncbi:ACP phosphodiesterase [Aliiglaciecola sp. LCG003]|uniref:acyl carrier protein phosphodiesterase n=1 Tax=Aliiglaciecola sp. LCG003 TaxID=3053655 RepID=UPI002572D432|nr:ACP phosphodiesterase [Aliiglaciecola sp. LCG003]WJG09256.1 ACP phosphodiesterase [Aliiglaciecola sp. LCG003]